ncbi:phenylacetic acid degradation protein PaaN [Streptomyces spiramenti]|uniref:Phenylacetic acid degradation protein PaaN n=1 Tax=Streptomyces spiramenti TaxID=2720606 RepID=A0ABX1APF6_9ACTN|nr:phenylacetic acid degradation protein PaaN [Streptomyces spiramenti]NJP68954.1 phenylacetic acid degradation protein PaaN [Streptomyces spiramenti]
MTPCLTPAQLADRHRGTLDTALEAIAGRGYWSPYPEHPKAYGDGATVLNSLDAEQGLAAFNAVRDSRFELDQPGTTGWVGAEHSPYGFALGVSYPKADIDQLLPAMAAAVPDWRDAGPETRALVCLEILARINAHTMEFAHAVMHTSGQAFMMAMQAGGPHAQDRGLEAVTYAYAEQTRMPRHAAWSKPQGKRGPIELSKEFTAVPRGVSLLVGCNTFPTWNGFPGLFASLAAGNPVLVKPHPHAVLPLAIAVRFAREVLHAAGFSRDLVTLVAEEDGGTIAADLARRPEVRIIDYTGSTAFGDWLETHAPQAQVYTEKAGVNTVVIDSTDNYKGMIANLAFSLSLYSGQMCTTPQNLLVPRHGITTDDGEKTYDQVVSDLAAAVEHLLADDSRAVSILGAIVSPAVRARVQTAPEIGDVALRSRSIRHPEFPDATVRTPVLVKLDAAKPEHEAAYRSECFGPVSFAVAVDSTTEALALLRSTVAEQGAMTVGGYTTDARVERGLVDVCLEECAQLSLNLTGGVYVNQTSAFSDLHGSGGNPSANAALVDAAFVADRFRVVEVRRQA